jgi:predicted ATPase
MAKIIKLGFKNYRIFDDSKIHEVEIKPFTIITGANSSGKSSIFKALMLLNDSKIKYNLLKLDFNEENHQLGSYKSLLNNEKNDEIVFEITFDGEFFNVTDEVKLRLVYKNAILDNLVFEISKQEIIKINNVDKEEFDIIFNFDYFKSNISNYNKIFDDEIFKGIFDMNFVKKTLLDELNIKKSNEEKNIDLISNSNFEVNENNITETNTKIENNINVIESNKTKIRDNKVIINSNEIKIEDIIFKIDSIKTKLDKENTELDKENTELKEEILNLEHEKSDLELKIKELNQEKSDLESNTLKLEGENSTLELKIKKLNQEKSDLEKLRNKEIQRLSDNYSIDENNINNLSINEFEDNIKLIKKSVLINFIDDFKDKINYNFNTLLKLKLNLLNFFNENYKTLKRTDIIFSYKNNNILDNVKDFILKTNENNKSEVYLNLYNQLIGNFLDILDKGELPFVHLPAFRGKQERVMTFTKSNNALENTMLYLSKIDYNKLDKNDKRKKIIKKFLKLFEIGKDIEINNIDGGVVNIFIQKNDRTKINLANLGFGISQLLPIIITCANHENKGKLICIEEPESNLHPKFQSLLVNLFKEAIKDFKVSFALETHSEYIISYSQFLIKNNRLIKENIIVYYINQEDTNKFIKIELNKDNNFIIDFKKYWSGFFESYIIKEKEKVFDIIKNNASFNTLIFTEDENEKDLDKIYFDIVGFNKNTTKIVSYKSKNNLSYATVVANVFSECNFEIKNIIFHRDKDTENITEADLKEGVTINNKINYFFFVTEGYEIENYLVNTEHILKLYSYLSKEKLEAIISESLNKLKDYTFGLYNYNSMDSDLQKEFETKYLHNAINMTKGKCLVNEIQKRIHEHLKGKVKGNINIKRKSEVNLIPKLTDILNEINKNN